MSFESCNQAAKSNKSTGRVAERRRVMAIMTSRRQVVRRLSSLRTVRIAAQPAVITSEEYFKEAGVVWMGDNFKTQFLGLEVPATEETELAVRKLEEASIDAPILAELGNKAEISVSQFRAFLASHRESREWFVFYLKGRDEDEDLWAVDAGWRAGRGGSVVCAFSVTDPIRWRQSSRVVSRK